MSIPLVSSILLSFSLGVWSTLGAIYRDQAKPRIHRSAMWDEVDGFVGAKKEES